MNLEKPKVEIIFENENYMVLNKPPFLSVHQDGKRKEYTLSDWVLENYPETENVGEDILTSNGVVIKKPGLVHRLDKNTSGIILVAKNQKTYLFFKELFQERKIQKKYKAFVYGKSVFDKKIITAEIGRSKNDFRKYTTGRGVRGKTRDAKTEYETIAKNDKFSYLLVSPKTGRTHQIRVHLKYDNLPIVADTLYAGKKVSENEEENLFFQRQALHAYSLFFIDQNGEKKEFIAEVPQDFKKAEKILGL
ncbi:hypothetical protein CSB11_02765 [Candidatus Campbellbacteria bacterium]|nr:MAG: hypothetical protein CSB11_02765 [Candidatus Campbellbacteria bacterium]